VLKTKRKKFMRDAHLEPKGSTWSEGTTLSQEGSGHSCEKPRVQALREVLAKKVLVQPTPADARAAAHREGESRKEVPNHSKKKPEAAKTTHRGVRSVNLSRQSLLARAYRRYPKRVHPHGVTVNLISVYFPLNSGTPYSTGPPLLTVRVNYELFMRGKPGMNVPAEVALRALNLL